MFDRWKNFGKMLCSDPGDGSLDNLSAEKFRSLLDKLDCDNAPVTGEELLKYIRVPETVKSMESCCFINCFFR